MTSIEGRKRHLEASLDILEDKMRSASIKDLPYLNQTYQKVIDELVRLDLLEEGDYHECISS